MGRLPSRYADMEITARLPYEMPTELALLPSQSAQPFNAEDLLNTVDKPFEVHRAIPRVFALDTNSLVISPQPDMDLLFGLVTLNMIMTGFTHQVTKSPTRISGLVKGTSERTWEFAEPFYLPNGRGVQVFASTLAFPAAFAGAGVVRLLTLVVFEGFQLVLAPARG